MANSCKNSAQEKLLFEQLIEKHTDASGKLIPAVSLLEKAAHEYADQKAIVADAVSLSYQELYKKVSLLATYLAKQGVLPGSLICLYLENTPSFYIWYWAALRLGAIATPFNTYLCDKELSLILQDALPTCVVAHKKSLPMFEKLKAELSHSWTLFEEGAEDALVETIEEIDQNCFSPAQGEEAAVILYTSGTTGTPKGVMLSSDNIVYNTLQAASRLLSLGFKQEVFFGILPLFHAFAQNTCMWLAALSGSTVGLVKKIERGALLAGLESYKPTIFFGFPALFGLLCLLKTAKLDSVKIFVSGADALPNKIKEYFALVYGRALCNGYGLTEASPIVAFNYSYERASSCLVGPLLPGIEVQIRNEKGQEVVPGGIGILFIKGKNVMKGYRNAPEATKAVLGHDGFFNTGDLARLDTQGRLELHGRNKDLIIHNGLNIYPQEIENALLSYPGVFKAAVLAREDEKGQVPVAFIATKSSSEGLAQKIRMYCHEHLASYKVPKEVIVLDDLPTLPTGKIDKKSLRL